MGLPNIIQYNLAAGANSTLLVNQSSAVATGAAFTLTTTILGTVQRKVQFSTVADESSNKFTIVGLNGAGFPITDVVTGPNASTTQSNLDFLTVTKITALNQTGGSVSVGSNSTGASLWQIVNSHVTPVNIELGCVLQTGAATFSIQYTYDDPNNLPPNVAAPTAFNHPTLNSIATSADGPINDPIFAWRVAVTAGTGTVRVTGIQAGIGGP